MTFFESAYKSTHLCIKVPLTFAQRIERVLGRSLFNPTENNLVDSGKKNMGQDVGYCWKQENFDTTRRRPGKFCQTGLSVVCAIKTLGSLKLDLHNQWS